MSQYDSHDDRPRFPTWLLFVILTAVVFAVLRFALPLLWRVMYYGVLVGVSLIVAAILVALFRKR